MAEIINEHKLSIKHIEYRDKIIEELSAILRDGNVDGDLKKSLIKKSEVKKDIGRSPDIGDVILMRVFFEIKSDMQTGNIDENVLQRQNDMFTRNERLVLNDNR